MGLSRRKAEEWRMRLGWKMTPAAVISHQFGKSKEAMEN